MPKLSFGILIKCEKTIKLYIQNLDKDNTIILKDLDEHHLLIEEKKLSKWCIKCRMITPIKKFKS